MVIVLAFRAEQASKAESLVDFMYFLNKKEKLDSCILIAASDCHDEYKTKIQLAAEVAFKHVEIITADKTYLFDAAIEYADSNLKSSWIYLEPDCVPVKEAWELDLQFAHQEQSKKILGAFQKIDDKIELCKYSVYPSDLSRFKGRDLKLMATKISVGGKIQLGNYSKREDVLPNTVLFCSDKSGELIKELRKELKK